MDEQATDYVVGYGKPPLETRFQKGRSGNPGGRPRGAKKLTTLLGEALSRRSRLPNPDGSSMTQAEAIFATLVAQAAGPDLSAKKLLFELLVKLQRADICFRDDRLPQIQLDESEGDANAETAAEIEQEAAVDGVSCAGQEPAAAATLPQHRGEPAMPIIDCQVHCYEANTPKRPWHSVPNWPPSATGDEMIAAMDKVGVDGAIFISAFSMYQYDASYAVAVQRAHPDRFAIVKPVNPDDPAVGDVIAEWRKQPGAVGVRIMLTREANRAPDDPGLDRICRAAAQQNFPVNVLFWGNVDAGTALIDRHPGTRFIVDHLAILQPREPPAPPEPWADLPKVIELAKRPNAVIKVSGACTLSKEPYPFRDIWDPLKRVFDAWGFERCLWGTDWTRAYAVVNYEQAVRPFVETDRLSDSERAMLMGGATAKAYGWSPKRG